MPGAAHRSADRANRHRGGKHRGSEQKVSFKSAPKERQSYFVGNHQALQCFGVHVVNRPHGEVADQKERHRTHQRRTQDRNMLDFF